MTLPDTSAPIHTDLVIVGSGPAGCTAAIYAARANLSPVVVEGSVTMGGALMNTTEIENFPGFPTGIQGPELMFNMREQAERFGAHLITDDALELDLLSDRKRVVLPNQTYLARSVILAMGSQWRSLGLESEERLFAKGVSTCATCDGAFFRTKDVAVVGGGDTAMEEALFLTHFASSVTVIHRRSTLRASRVMQDRARAHEKIRFLFDTEVKEVLGDSQVEALRLSTASGEETTLPVSALFLAIGHIPRSQLVAHQVEVDSEGYVKVSSPSTRTSLPGVFAAGDLVDHTYRQAITAAGTGAAAALDAERFLSGI